MDEPQPCSRCKKIPEDILMLECSHDLCLQCAAERLNVELKKKKSADSIECEICSQSTALDLQSVAELTKMIPQPVQRSISRQVEQKPFRQSEELQYRTSTRDLSTSGFNNNNILISGISSKKTCGQHIDEDILYFCFTCKCECICPQCVIHGKHKDHEVKTIKKSYPIVKAQLESTLDKIESSIQTLLIRKNEVEKNLRVLNDQNSQSKRQIQIAFEEIRSKLDAQEKELLTRCDLQLNEALQELEKSTKSVMKRIDELKSYSTVTVQYMKKDEQTMLNFYAKKWKQISEQCKQQSITVQTISLPSNESILGGIMDIGESVERIGSLAASRKR